MAEISFRPLNKQDFSHLHRWLNEAHMRSFYQRHPVSLEDVAEKYSPRVEGKAPTHCHIALVNGAPIGKIQCYRVADYPEYGKEIGVSDGISVDLFIGEPSLLRQGIGKAILTSYLETVAFALFPDEVSCYICHEKANSAALACSRSAGFKYVRDVVEDGSACELLVYERKPAKTWFAIDGALEPIDFEGPSYFRFPISLARFVLEKFCPPGGAVFDPFVGFGTTLLAAQKTGRWGVGFEYDEERMAYARGRVKAPSKVIHDRIQNFAHHDLPRFDLIFTSPPYASFSGPQNDPPDLYIRDLESIFASLQALMKPEAKLVLEISNVKDNRGIVPLAFLATQALMKHYDFEGELVRCNTGNAPAGPGYDHSYLLVFKRRDQEKTG